MPTITVTNEENLDELLDRLNGGLKPDEFKRVRDATLEINPHLRLQGNFKPGTLIALPNLDQIDPKVLAPGNHVSTTGGVDSIMAAIKDHVPLLIAELKSNERKLAQVTKSIPSILKLAEAAKTVEVVNFANKIEGALKTEREANKKTLSNLSKEVNVLQADLLALLKSLS